MNSLTSMIVQWGFIILLILVLGQANETYKEYKKNKVIKISITGFVVILILFFSLLYSFVYKPYFTTMGQITRETKRETRLKEKTLYYACSLPKDNRLYLKLSKECKELELRAEYESEYQDCAPDYMGGCN